MHYLQEEDLEYVWHPCSQMKDYEEFPPIIIEKGQGAYVYDIFGNSYLDAISSWWVNLFGHSNKRINEAINKQLQKLEHVIFANFSHEGAILLAKRLIEIAPPNLKKVFFADNGSSSVEIALKMSFQYHQQTGNDEKTKFVSISDAYHGETIGALSIGDIDLYSKIYKPMLMNTFKAKGPDCFRCEYNKYRNSCNTECFTHMEELVLQNHNEICGICVEPLIQCAAGMKIYPPQYLIKLRKLCDEYNIHLIADEIAVGFGRTGLMFACEHANISPDIMCISKGLSAGYLPLALTLTTNKIYKAFYSDYQEQKAFLHSHSYTGNPISCSVALESLNIFQDEDILNKNIEKARAMRIIANKYFNNHPNIGEYRQLGMIGAVELVQDKKTKLPFDWKDRIGYKIYKETLKRGVILRPLGNVIYFMPPYIIEPDDIEKMMKVGYDALVEVLGE